MIPENRFTLNRMIDQYKEDSFVIGTRNVPKETVHRYGIIEPAGEVKD